MKIDCCCFLYKILTLAKMKAEEFTILDMSKLIKDIDESIIEIESKNPFCIQNKCNKNE